MGEETKVCHSSRWFRRLDGPFTPPPPPIAFLYSLAFPWLLVLKVLLDACSFLLVPRSPGLGSSVPAYHWDILIALNREQLTGAERKLRSHRNGICQTASTRQQNQELILLRTELRNACEQKLGRMLLREQKRREVCAVNGKGVRKGSFFLWRLGHRGCLASLLIRLEHHCLMLVAGLKRNAEFCIPWESSHAVVSTGVNSSLRQVGLVSSNLHNVLVLQSAAPPLHFVPPFLCMPAW